MAGEDFSIKNLLMRLIRSEIKVSAFVGKVSAVNKEENTCDVVDAEGLERLDVRLTSSVGELGNCHIVMYPKIGTQATCVILENKEESCQLIGCDEVESAELSIPEVLIKSDKIQINEGLNGV